VIATLSLLTWATTASAEGWYLLAPPWRTTIDELDTTAPLTRWEQKGAFDSALICEDSKTRIVQLLEKGEKERLDQAAESKLTIQFGLREDGQVD
jgi:hypothetical protein